MEGARCAIWARSSVRCVSAARRLLSAKKAGARGTTAGWRGRGDVNGGAGQGRVAVAGFRAAGCVLGREGPG